jgi:16S rRNA (guanine(966)-N(2))-methyltransferase RsmD
VIAGEKRGVRLQSPPGEDVRPTYDRVREAVFGKLQFTIANKAVLDLFAGSGAMGIEALSRGAEFVCFVDKNEGAISTVRSNIAKTQYEKKCRIIKNDYISALKLFKNGTKFDIVFIDPPYASGYYEKALGKMDAEGLLRPGALIVLESDHLLKAQLQHYAINQTKKYGKTIITYLEYKP